jgi:hypothetical protein
VILTLRLLAEVRNGEGVEDLARKNLGGFRADWSIGAHQTQAAPWLLIDESNPSIRRPKICTFEHNGQRQTVTLDWTRIKREDLLPRLKKAIGAGEAGFGVRQVGGGYWIALQSLLDARTLEVVKAVEEQKTALQEAPFVVLDLRGNHGGSSLIGRQIAASLLGSAVMQPDCSGPDGAWRTSEGNIHNLEFLRTTPFVLHGALEQQKLIDNTLRDARAARAQGKAFSASIVYPVTPPKSANTSTLINEGAVDSFDGQYLFQLVPGRPGRFPHSRRIPYRPDDGCRHSLRRCARTIPTLGLFNVFHSAISRPE